MEGSFILCLRLVILVLLFAPLLLGNPPPPPPLLLLFVEEAFELADDTEEEEDGGIRALPFTLPPKRFIGRGLNSLFDEPDGIILISSLVSRTTTRVGKYSSSFHDPNKGDVSDVIVLLLKLPHVPHYPLTSLPSTTRNLERREALGGWVETVG